MNRLTLTFDNGPTLDTTPYVLDLLQERGFSAYFCVIGRQLEKSAEHTELVKETQRRGHKIVHHSLTHGVALGDDPSAEHARSEVLAMHDLISRNEGLHFTGKAKSYHGENAAMKAIMEGDFGKGDVVVVRYEGPHGGPGTREMLSPTSATNGRGLSKDEAMIADGRFSGGRSQGFVIGHAMPEAFDGGVIALLEGRDEISVGAENWELNVKLSEKELAERKAKWVRPEPYATRGTLAKNAKLVSNASRGAATDVNQLLACTFTHQSSIGKRLAI